MSMPPSRARSAREAFGQPFGGRVSGLGKTQGPDQSERPRARLPLKLTVAVVSGFLLASTALGIVPAVRAGLRDGTRGTWVATTKTCHGSACIWSGKFVAPAGHIVVASAHYAGSMPTGIQAGTSVPALFTGDSKLVFPVTGSDLWIELLIALLISVLGLYWASHTSVDRYLREWRNRLQTLRP